MTATAEQLAAAGIELPDPVTLTDEELAALEDQSGEPVTDDTDTGTGTLHQERDGQVHHDGVTKRQGEWGNGRRRLLTNYPPVFAARVRNNVGIGELAGMFRRAGELVHTPRIGEDGYQEPEPGQDLGPAQVRPLNAAQLKALVEIKFAVQVLRELKDPATGQKKPATFPDMAPRDAIQNAWDAARLGEDVPNLRELRGVTHTPTMRPDGSILDRPGYDDATGFLFLPDPGLTVPTGPAKPTAKQVKAARSLLLGLVDQVPWVSDDNQATWLGLALTPLLRAVLPGPYPLGIFTAPNPGSGKSRLAAMIRMLHGGVLRGDLPADKEELRKQITATLVDTTAPVVVWDNLTGVIRSPVLEALLTTDTWSDRYLGHSRDVSAPNDRLWLATGNNATIGGDLGRRVLVVEIDHRQPNPHLLTHFRIDHRRYVPEHRGELLAAMLTLARGWHMAGRPEDRDRADDYATWAGALRGLLAWAGIPGRFGGETSTIASKVDPETIEWAAFMAEIHRAYADRSFTTKELVKSLNATGSTWDPNTPPVDADVLPGELAHKWERVANNYGDGSRAGFSKSLGHWLRFRSGRYADGWKVEQVADSDKGNAYRVMAP
jgi:hypothetical protein